MGLRRLAALLLLVAAPRAGAEALGVLTYNVAGLPEGLSGSHPEANHPLISPLLDAYDLVLVQEDFAYHDLLVADLEHPYQSVRDTNPGPLGTGLGDGLDTFSLLPFQDFARVPWTDCYGVLTNASDCLTPKGLSFQRHELAPGAFLDVYNWHADAGDAPEDLAARRANVRQLYTEIVARSGGHAVLVMGDTNSRYTRDGDILPELLAAVGLRDVWVELERGGVLPPVGPALTAGCVTDLAGGDCERVDKILYRSSPWVEIAPAAHEVPDERFSDAQGEPLSDHAPVFAQLEVTVVPEPGAAVGAVAALGGLMGFARLRLAARFAAAEPAAALARRR